jgi:hypothetical protein
MNVRFLHRRQNPLPVMAILPLNGGMSAGGALPPGPPPHDPAPPPMGAPMPPPQPPAESSVIADLLAALQPYLPPPTLGLPPPVASVVSVQEKRVGVGNLRGTDVRASYPAVLLKGGRLDAVVRFQLWAAAPADIATAIAALLDRILAAQTTLRGAGFLQLVIQNTSPPEVVPVLNAWRQSIDVAVLYEYQYEDGDGAYGLIARIPVAIDGGLSESMLLTDEMARWEHDAANPLLIDGLSNPGLTVSALSILAYLPAGWDGHAVTLSASTGGSVHQQIFPTVRTFANAFTLETETVDLGGNLYVPGTFNFPHPPQFPDPLRMQTGNDNLRVSYADPAFDNVDAALYLRALS